MAFDTAAATSPTRSGVFLTSSPGCAATLALVLCAFSVSSREGFRAGSAFLISPTLFFLPSPSCLCAVCRPLSRISTLSRIVPQVRGGRNVAVHPADAGGVGREPFPEGGQGSGRCFRAPGARGELLLLLLPPLLLVSFFVPSVGLAPTVLSCTCTSGALEMFTPRTMGLLEYRSAQIVGFPDDVRKLGFFSWSRSPFPFCCDIRRAKRLHA